MIIRQIIKRTLKRFGFELHRINVHGKSNTSSESIQAIPENQNWSYPFETLRKKWDVVPTSSSKRQKTERLYNLSDDKLRNEWLKCREDITTGSEFRHRGWYHALYSEGMRNKKIMDIGSGFAVDSITFAQKGARVTFVDIHESNLNVVRRLCKIFEIEDAQFHLLTSIESLEKLDTNYDFLMAMGSLHHAPVSVIKPEVNELIRHLKIGGRWLQLAYPKTRWEREGRPSFYKWGEITDGAGTPWAESYDIEKLLGLFENAAFEVVLCQEFHNNDFIWFDLLYKGKKTK